MDERHAWWLQQYTDTDGKLLKKGLTFPYSASDLLAIFHALADGHKTKEDMKNHFLTVVKHVDRYLTVILPLTEEDKLQAKQQQYTFEVNYKWDKLGYEVFHRKYSGPRSKHIPALSGMPQWSERILMGNLLPHPTGKRSFACPNGLCDLYSACLLGEALARQGNDTCGKGSIPHAQVLQGYPFRAYAKNGSDWNLHQYQVTIAKIGNPKILEKTILDEVPEFTDLYEVAGGLEAEDEKPSVKKQKKVKAERG
ncbi:hypothetical protein L486_07183 [Kwoniella mangroviensis CBS 10435]|uniref:Uncharacterized protein n=1 Tax=Kwoniella mangroviensis CBS 10435 TaxID=1331196 RepID=A0A1B9IHW4_9TREE|nr:hypothetical protein L486_07183 [Kwoniella mangroviensis CBS 10435]